MKRDQIFFKNNNKNKNNSGVEKVTSLENKTIHILNNWSRFNIGDVQKFWDCLGPHRLLSVFSSGV